MAGPSTDIGLPSPGGDKVYIVTQKALGDLKKKIEPLIRLEVGPGLKLVRGDTIWRVELDILGDNDGTGSGGALNLSTKQVTICEDDSPVTYTFIIAT